MTHWPGEGEGKSSHGPTGQQGCAGRVGTASPGVLLVGSRVGGLGGPLRAPGLLAVGDVGEEEALGWLPVQPSLMRW